MRNGRHLSASAGRSRSTDGRCRAVRYRKVCGQHPVQAQARCGLLRRAAPGRPNRPPVAAKCARRDGQARVRAARSRPVRMPRTWARVAAPSSERARCDHRPASRTRGVSAMRRASSATAPGLKSAARQAGLDLEVDGAARRPSGRRTRHGGQRRVAIVGRSLGGHDLEACLRGAGDLARRDREQDQDRQPDARVAQRRAPRRAMRRTAGRRRPARTLVRPGTSPWP